MILAKTVLQQLAREFTMLGKLFKSMRTGQFSMWEPYIINEKICDGLSEICLDFAKTKRTPAQTAEINRKLRIIRNLMKKSSK